MSATDSFLGYSEAWKLSVNCVIMICCSLWLPVNHEILFVFSHYDCLEWCVFCFYRRSRTRGSKRGLASLVKAANHRRRTGAVAHQAKFNTDFVARVKRWWWGFSKKVFAFVRQHSLGLIRTHYNLDIQLIVTRVTAAYIPSTALLLHPAAIFWCGKAVQSSQTDVLDDPSTSLSKHISK